MDLDLDVRLYLILKGDIFLKVDFILSRVDYFFFIKLFDPVPFISFFLCFFGTFTNGSYISIESASYAEDWETEGWQINAELLSVRKCHKDSGNRLTLWESITQTS